MKENKICPKCGEKAEKQYAYMTECYEIGTSYDHDLYALPPLGPCEDCGQVEKNHHKRFRVFYCVNEKCENLNQIIYRKLDKIYSWDYKGCFVNEKIEA